MNLSTQDGDNNAAPPRLTNREARLNTYAQYIAPLWLTENYSPSECRWNYRPKPRPMLLIQYSCSVARKQRGGQRYCVTRAAAGPVELTCVGSGDTKVINGPILVGSAKACDIQIVSAQPRHAKLEVKGGRLFCTALTAGTKPIPDPSDIYAMPPSSQVSQVFIDDNEIRPGVAYLVAPAATIRFGTDPSDALATWVAHFEEQNNTSPIMEMMMKGMAQSASEDVKKKLDQM